MTVAYAAATACFAVLCACGHSILIERRLVVPLLADLEGSVFAQPRARGMIRFLAHFPSGAWIVLGAAIVAARVHGGATVLSIAAATIYAGSGLVSAAVIRRVHVGTLLSLLAAAAAIADILANC